MENDTHRSWAAKGYEMESDPDMYVCTHIQNKYVSRNSSIKRERRRKRERERESKRERERERERGRGREREREMYLGSGTVGIREAHSCKRLWLGNALEE